MWKYVKLRGIVEDHKKEKHEEAGTKEYVLQETRREGSIPKNKVKI